MEQISLAKGGLITGIGDRKGRWALQQHVSGINVHGGKRVHQPEKDRLHWIHPLMTTQLMPSSWKPEQHCMQGGMITIGMLSL
jgi:hypothetical protein